MNRLHDNGTEAMAEGSVEFNAIDHDKRLARIVAAEVAASLQVGHGDRDIVVKLLTTTLEKQLCSRGDGLLEQYLHTQLDILAKTFKHEFDLDDADADVDYNYATHAKFNNIINAIKVKHNSNFGDNI